jgi:hypothetical protein
MNRASAPLMQLLRLVDEAFDRKAWHGPTLRGSLRGVRAEQAAWRAAPQAHNIWELTVHAAYWKYAIRRALVGEKRVRFPLKGSNWFSRPAKEHDSRAKTNDAWRADLKLLREQHLLLRQTIAGVNPDALDRRLRGRATSAGFLIRGIAAHDLYHAGQVGLLKRLYKSRPAR